MGRILYIDEVEPEDLSINKYLNEQTHNQQNIKKEKRMKVVSVDNANEAFLLLLKSVKNDGVYSSPRNMLIKEVIGVGICINNPRNRIVQNSVRTISPHFAIGENLWYLRGSNKLDIIGHYSSIYKKFSDNGETLHGAYGPKIFEQIDKCIDKLKKDPDSRQAIISIFTPFDLLKDSKDTPCTCTIQFLLRDSKLNMLVHMRSNDLFLGFPYDVFSFTIIQELLALKLNVSLGNYYHFIGSLHVYEKDFNKLSRINSQSISQVEMPKFTHQSLKEIDEVLKAESILRNNNQTIDTVTIKDNNWRNFIDVLMVKKNNKYDKEIGISLLTRKLDD